MGTMETFILLQSLFPQYFSSTLVPFSLEWNDLTNKSLTKGGDTSSELTRFLYFDMFLDGSIKSCRSSNSLMYFVGTLSQACLSLDTEPCPRPLTRANIELKFLHSLQCPIKSKKWLFLLTMNLQENDMTCTHYYFCVYQYC